jgi:hypothetical protein
MSDVTGDVTRDITRDVTRDMKVDWAKELGIDLEKLAEERPLHPMQIWERRQHEARAETYWALADTRERRLREALGVAELELRRAEELLATRR